VRIALAEKEILGAGELPGIQLINAIAVGGWRQLAGECGDILEKELPDQTLDDKMHSDMEHLVTINPNVLGGTPCFAGTRVPVRSLFDHLEGGYTVDYFLTQFPSVKREQVLGVLENSRLSAERSATPALSR
jgi:uncharacterized protein (DUF433 family)